MLFHSVRFRYFTDHTAGISRGQAMGRNASSHNTARTDDTAFPNGHTAADSYICGDPAVLFYGDRFGILQIVVAAIITLSYVLFLRQKRMHRCCQSDVRTNQHIIPNVYRAYIKTGEVEIGCAEFTEIGVAAIVKINGGLQAG